MAISVTPATASANVYFPLPSRPQPGARAARATNTNAALAAFGFNPLLGTDTSQQASDVFGISDLIDLSPQAQNFLDFFNNAADAFVNNTAINDNGILLTPTQQAQISAVIVPFKDAPFTPETLSQIQQNLAAAGLTPEQLAAQQEQSPLGITDLFLRALGNEDTTPPATDFTGVDTQADQATQDAYTRQIFAEWERVSTTFKPMAIASFIENPFNRRRNNE